MYACRPSLGALSLFPVTHPAVVAVPFTRPPPTRPPLPCHALYALYHVCASACPVCGMGACGVCVVSGCECGLRVGSCWANRAVGQVLNSAVRGLSSPARGRSWGGGSGHGSSGLRAMLPNWQRPYCPALTFSPPVGQWGYGPRAYGSEVAYLATSRIPRAARPCGAMRGGI